jgi:hypothetical protein
VLLGVGVAVMTRAMASARRGETPTYGGRGPDNDPEPDDEAEGPGAEEVGPPPSSARAGEKKEAPEG